MTKKDYLEKRKIVKDIIEEFESMIRKTDIEKTFIRDMKKVVKEADKKNL